MKILIKITINITYILEEANLMIYIHMIYFHTITLGFDTFILHYIYFNYKWKYIHIVTVRLYSYSYFHNKHQRYIPTLIVYHTSEFTKRVREMSYKLFVTLYTHYTSSYPSAHKHLIRQLLNPFREFPFTKTERIKVRTYIIEYTYIYVKLGE